MTVFFKDNGGMRTRPTTEDNLSKLDISEMLKSDPKLSKIQKAVDEKKAIDEKQKAEQKTFKSIVFSEGQEQEQAVSGYGNSVVFSPENEATRERIEGLENQIADLARKLIDYMLKAGMKDDKSRTMMESLESVIESMQGIKTIE